MAQDLNAQSFVTATTPSQESADHITVILSDEDGLAPFTLEEGEGLRIYKRFPGGSTVLIASGDVPTGATPDRTWRVTGYLQIVQSPPVSKVANIALVSPSDVSPSDVLSIQGSDFSPTLLDNVVELDGEPCTVLSASPFELTAEVPPTVTAGDDLEVTVVVDGTPATADDPDAVLVNVLGPTISGFSPSSGRVSAQVTITGSEFSTVLGDNVVTFTGSVLDALVVSASKEELVVEVPRDADASGQIDVVVGENGAATDGDFTRTNHTVSSLTVSSGPVGTAVTINGTGFSDHIADHVVRFNGTLATVTSATSTALQTTVPVGATTGAVTVAIGAVSVGGGTFTVV